MMSSYKRESANGCPFYRGSTSPLTIPGEGSLSWRWASESRRIQHIKPPRARMRRLVIRHRWVASHGRLPHHPNTRQLSTSQITSGSNGYIATSPRSAAHPQSDNSSIDLACIFFWLGLVLDASPLQKFSPKRTPAREPRLT